MSVTAKLLVPSKTVENTQTTQYTAIGLTTIIDKFTATNYSGSTTTLAVNLVNPSGSASSSNLIVTKSLQAGETYRFPELVGQTLSAGCFISTIAGAATSVNMRVSGREITA